MKKINGAQPFVYLSASPKDWENVRGKAKAATTDHSDTECELCPQFRKKYSRTEDIVLLNPSQGEEGAMREAMGRKRLLGPVKKPKLSEKRKNGSPTDDAEHPAKKRGKSARALRYLRRVRWW